MESLRRESHFVQPSNNEGVILLGTFPQGETGIVDLGARNTLLQDKGKVFLVLLHQINKSVRKKKKKKNTVPCCKQMPLRKDQHLLICLRGHQKQVPLFFGLPSRRFQVGQLFQ